jgi:hypothetical protein
MERPGRMLAKDVSQMMLEVTGKAILAGDFGAFAPHFHLPHFIATSEHKATLETLADLRHVFDKVRHDYLRKRITNLVRICEVAEYRTDSRIEATHITHMMAGDQRVTDPFPAFSVLEFIDGRWQVSSSQYAVDNNTSVGHALSTPRGGLPKA